MKLHSKFFDTFRKGGTTEATPRAPVCSWPGCSDCGTHRAPLGRSREGQYTYYCFEHVKEYNKSYNYFKDMDDDAIAAFQREASVGHRPTWRMGGRDARGPAAAAAERFAREGAAAPDPMQMFERLRREEAAERRAARPIHNAARQALRTLDLDAGTSAADIKRRFHELVKRHHPDANGGDTSSEAKLREAIQAYNCLKQSGHC